MLIDLGKGRYLLNTEDDTCAKAAIEAYADACRIYNPKTEALIRRGLPGSPEPYICIETALRIVASAHLIGRQQEHYSKGSWDQVKTTLLSLTPKANCFPAVDISK